MKRGETIWVGIIGTFKRSVGLAVGSVIVVVFILVALLAPLVAPGDPNSMNVLKRLSSPSASFWLGSDHLGRDLFTRILYGARISLVVGAASTLGSALGGIVLGLMGGFHRRIGGIIMRVIDGMMALPGMLLALALMAVLGPSVANIVVALIVIYTPRMARVQHAAVLQIKNRDYITAAHATGASQSYIMFRHVLPNSYAPVVVQSTFTFAYAIVAEASLSFLGVGSSPDTPSWGNILANGRDYLLAAPWICLIPGLAIFAVVIGLNLAGDGIRDVFDPHRSGIA